MSVSLLMPEHRLGNMDQFRFSLARYPQGDALHLVCGFHDNEDAQVEGLYLEGKDQAQGGTGWRSRCNLCRTGSGYG